MRYYPLAPPPVSQVVVPVEPRIPLAGALVAVWGVAGVSLLLTQAIMRLAPIAAEALAAGPSASSWLLLAGWLAFMGYFEGYRGFQCGFAPRVIERARELAWGPRPLRALLAPLYCMSLISATRRRMVVSWSVTLGVVTLVVLVRLLAQPWRGIIDAGVVLGLAWGQAAILVLAFGAARRSSVRIDAPHLGVDELRGIRRL